MWCLLRRTVPAVLTAAPLLAALRPDQRGPARERVERTGYAL